MFQLFVKDLCEELKCIEVNDNARLDDVYNVVSEIIGIPVHDFALVRQGLHQCSCKIADDVEDGSTYEVKLKICGGIDYQHREGSKIGSGGQMSEAQAAMERKERLRKLALETIDITKDPYFLRNHLGSFECKLCLTLHVSEGNYLAHTQGKRHQYNLGRRAAMEAKNAAPKPVIPKEAPIKRTIKIGKPGYKVHC